eukprot:EG_transcript_30160
MTPGRDFWLQDEMEVADKTCEQAVLPTIQSQNFLLIGSNFGEHLNFNKPIKGLPSQAEGFYRARAWGKLEWEDFLVDLGPFLKHGLFGVNFGHFSGSYGMNEDTLGWETGYGND